MTKNRLEAFSDGVFAIVITLLILDIHLPSDEVLTLAALAPIVSHVFAFALSFVVVGVYWVSHHNMMHFMKAVDRQMLWLNLALLLAVVFIPFPAALLGQHPTEPLAVILYGMTLMLVNMTGTIFWLYATGRPHLRARGVSPSFARLVARVHSAPILVYGTAIVLAPWSVYASLALFVAVPAFFILPNPLLDRWLASAQAATGSEGSG